MAEQEKQPVAQGWKDVQITPDMPLVVLINFMNVLNQRLVALEDVTQVPFNNKMVTLTELYALQAEEMKKQAESQGNSEEPAPEEHEEN